MLCVMDRNEFVDIMMKKSFSHDACIKLWDLYSEDPDYLFDKEVINERWCEYESPQAAVADLEPDTYRDIEHWYDGDDEEIADHCDGWLNEHCEVLYTVNGILCDYQ